jgi:hypothetical protein
LLVLCIMTLTNPQENDDVDKRRLL